MKLFEEGLASTGDALLGGQFITTGAVIWVDSVAGSDAYAGDKETPLATLAAAISAATANSGDVIVIKAGHSETLTSPVTFSKAGIKVCGLGTGSGAPNFLCNAAIDCFTVTAANVEINNLYFPAGTTATNTARINVDATRVKIKGCTFVCGVYDQHTITITTNGTYARLQDCMFSVSADGPDDAVILEAAVTGLYVQSCTFDGSTYNWDDGAIYSAQAHTNFIYDTCTLSNNARIKHTSASAKGILGGITLDENSSLSLA